MRPPETAFRRSARPEKFRPLLVCVLLAALVPGVARAQTKPKSTDDIALEKLDAFSDALFKKTRRSVEDRLQDLDEKANHLFDQGTEIAMAAMTAHIEERLARFKSALFGTPPEAEAIYADGKKQFEEDMKALSVRVANVIADEVAGAKREIELAKARIAAERAKLPASARARAEERPDYFGKLIAFADSAGRALH